MRSEGIVDVHQRTATQTAASIRAYVRQNMTALHEAELRDDDNIFEQGLVTSIFAMQLLDYLESAFGVVIPDDRITLRNFSSVGRMVEMVEELRNADE